MRPSTNSSILAALGSRRAADAGPNYRALRSSTALEGSLEGVGNLSEAFITVESLKSIEGLRALGM
jgi:hypothetical protein